MYIAFHRSHQDLAVGGIATLFFQLDKGLQVRHSLLHHPGTFYNLGQKHLAGAEKIANDVHTIH